MRYVGRRYAPSIISLDKRDIIWYSFVMATEKKLRDKLGLKISECLQKLRKSQGWSIDDLASYLEVNNLTIRNAISRGVWSDLLVTILKLTKTVPEELCYEYKKATERCKIEIRKSKAF